jgi:hypothetical protein
MNDMVPEEASAAGTEPTPAPASASASASSQSATPAEGGTPKRHRLRRTRGIIAWILLVLASLLIPIAVISGWAITTVTNTDQYVATMAPLARNEVIQQHLATKATDALFSTHAAQNKIESVLPEKAKPIVQPITDQVKGYVHDLALKVFESPRFGRLWDGLNRRSHSAVVDILTGKQSARLQKLEKGGQIVLNLTPALNQVIDKANSRGVTLFNPLKSILAKNESLSFTIVSKDQVSKFSGYFNLIVKLRWWIPIIALAVGILSIVVAVQRRKTLLRLTVGIALFTLVLLGVLSYGRGVFIQKAASHNLDTGVTGAVWDTMLRFLKTSLRWTVLASVVVAFGAWVFGPARYAVSIRSACARAGRWVAAQWRALTGAAGAAAAESDRVRRSAGWILEHLNLFRVAGIAVAALVLLFGGNLTGWGLLVIVIVLAVYLGLLQLVAVWARRVASPAAGSRPA